MQSFPIIFKSVLRSAESVAASRILIVIAGILTSFLSLPVLAQQANPKAPVVVRPGAPGEATRTLPPNTRAKLPPSSLKDVEFMQGMIMHHAQAVEMTDMIESRTENKDIRLLGSRISKSQEEEMKFMKRWLDLRGQPVSPQMSHTSGHHHHDRMPGMLSPDQMEALKKARGAEFDRLFLAGMIQHHKGALVMVKELFDAPGAGQDAELFNFASDVDSGQRAEIATMETLLNKKS